VQQVQQVQQQGVQQVQQQEVQQGQISREFSILAALNCDPPMRI
jgi:hypothetical protein